MVSGIVHFEGGIGGTVLVALLAEVFIAHVLGLNMTHTRALVGRHEATVSAGKLIGSGLNNFRIDTFSLVVVNYG